jgi:hypothetical protein
MRSGNRLRWFVGPLLVLLTATISRADLVDPVGDTFGLGIRHDIVAVESSFATGLRLTVHFAGPVAAPSTFSPNSVVGYIDIDLDQDSKTGGLAPWGVNLVGGNSWINFFSAPNPGAPAIPPPFNTLIDLGDKLYVNLFSELFHPGRVDVHNTATNAVVATVPILYGPTWFAVDLEAALGGDFLFHYGVLAGTLTNPTDRAPNGSAPALIPEPSSFTLLALAGVALALSCRLLAVSRQRSARQRPGSAESITPSEPAP